jgi:hypothetical protein
MQDYPQMVADEQNYGYSDSQPAQENAQYANLMKQAYQNNPSAFQSTPVDTSRQLPVIGPILRGLDAVAQNPIVNKVADIARDFYVPGAGAANIAGLAGAAENGISRLLPGLADSAAGRVAQKAASEAVVGAPVGAGQSLMTNPDESNTELLQNAGLGAAMGAGLGVAGKAVGAGLNAIADKYAGTKLGDALSNLMGRNQSVTPEQEQATQQILALPPASRYDDALARSQGTVLPPGESPIYGTGDIYKEPTLALPEGNYVPPQRFKALTGNDYLDSVLNQIKPDVEQMMTVPTRRDLLVNYIQDHLQVPREEIHNMPITDLQELGQGIRNNLSVYDLATQAAAKRGYDLPKILEGEIPSIQSRVASDAQKRVYGIYPNEITPIKRPETFNKQVISEAAAPIQKTGFSNTTETPVKVSRSSMDTRPSDRLKSLSEVKSSIQEPRLQSPSEIKAANQAEALNAEVKPEPRMRDKVVSFMNEKAAEAQARINARNKIGFLPAQGNDFVDHAIIAAAHMVENGVNYADYAEFMVKKFGNDIKAHLPDIYQNAVQIAKKDAKLTDKDIDRSRNVAQFARNNEDNAIPDTRSQLVSKTKTDKIPLADKTRAAYIKNIDDVHRLSNYDKYVSDVLGRDLKATEKTHTLALNSRSSDVISNYILTHDLVDSRGNPIHLLDENGKPFLDAKGKPVSSFKDIVQQIPKGKQGEFEEYLINKHAITRMQRGEKVFADELKMSPEKSEQIVKAYDEKYPQFQKIAQQYYEFNRKLGKAWLVDTGLIPQEVFDAWGKENPFYVPMQREFSELEKAKTFNSKSGGYGNQSKTVKEYSHVGSQRQIVSPIESTIEQIDRYVKTAKRNEVMQALIKNIEKSPDDFKDWAEVVSKENPDLKKMLDEEGIDGVLNQIDEPLQRAQSKTDLTKSNIVNGLINGEKVYVKVHDAQLLDALSNLHPSAQNVLIAALGKASRVVKNLTTGINPLFSLTRNIFRDIPDAYRYSTTTNNPAKFAWDLFHAIGSELTHGKLSQEYKAMGGGHSGNISASRNLLSHSKNKILQADNIGQKAMKGILGAFHTIENINSAFEQGPRLAEYKRSVQKNGGDYNAKVQGLYNANDITVNFNRRGQVSKDIDSLMLYYNAAIQGLDKFVRSMNPRNPKQFTAGILKAVAAVTVPQMVLYAINKDDPNFQKLSNYTKDNYFVIPRGDGTFFKIPKPREIGLLFGTLVERAMRQFAQNDPHAWKGISDTLINTFAPPGISGVVKGARDGGIIGAIEGIGSDSIGGPLVDLAQNKDFAGRTIVPNDLKNRSPSMQYDTKTSDVAKLLGNIFNSSPKQIDYLIKSYGGIIGQLGIPAATTGNGGNPLSRLGNSIKQNVTADPTYSNDIANNFYTAKTQYDQAKADAQAQGKVSNTIGIDTMLSRLSTTVSQIRKQMNTIQNNTNMPDDEKQQRIKALQLQMNNIQQQALNSIQKYQQKAK